MFSQMRPGAASYTSDEEDRAFMQFGPLIMSGVAERLTQTGGAGKLHNVLVNLDKDSVLLMKFRNGHLALSVDRNDAFGVFQEIDVKLRELE
jgi:predicted regulator of Ras-like GTPase activity (Roadblock/LC7/MglB family)